MSVFTEEERAYLGEQRLGRLATVGSDGNPHVVPLTFRYNAETDTIDLGGHHIAQSRKWRDAARHARVAFVVDDVLPPWRPRMIEIRADVELLETGGQQFGPGFAPELMRLHPVQIVAFGLGSSEMSNRKAGG
jgi:pyridoxamine 5'-phosphate oxidase family protein